MRGLFTGIRRALLLVGAIAAAWGLVIWVSGGFVIRAGPVRLSSRTPASATVIALLAAAAVLAIPVPDRWRSLRGEIVSWAHPACIAALAGIGLQVLQWVHARPLWLDEEMIALNLRERGVWEMAGGLWLGQSAPFGWLTLQKLALVALGDGERALRLIPLIFAGATVAAAAVIGRRWMDAWGATLLVLLCSFGQWLSYYSFELKHYSADIFWALALPALGAWLLESRRESVPIRSLVWWSAAAIGQWLANGAFLATPGCAVALLLLVRRHFGIRAAAVFVAQGTIWLASFGLHFPVAVRHALQNRFLETYWAFALPPEGLFGTFRWLAEQLAPLADKPGGSSFAPAFWIAAAAGFVLTRRAPLAALFASVPLSAFGLAALRLVPLFERLSLWIVPALYVGFALLLDAAVATLRDKGPQASWRRVVLAGGAAALAIAVSADVVWRGVFDLRNGRPASSNHLLDDRSAVKWLIAERRPGDVLIATHLALPALWWYGRIPIADASGAGSRTSEGLPIVEASYEGPGRRCASAAAIEALAGSRRALVYFGFRFDDVPNGFDDLVIAQLSGHGVISVAADFASAGRVVIIELGQAAGPVSRARLAGCAVMKRAERW